MLMGGLVMRVSVVLEEVDMKLWSISVDMKFWSISEAVVGGVLPKKSMKIIATSVNLKRQSKNHQLICTHVAIQSDKWFF